MATDLVVCNLCVVTRPILTVVSASAQNDDLVDHLSLHRFFTRTDGLCVGTVEISVELGPHSLAETKNL